MPDFLYHQGVKFFGKTGIPSAPKITPSSNVAEAGSSTGPCLFCAVSCKVLSVGFENFHACSSSADRSFFNRLSITWNLDSLGDRIGIRHPELPTMPVNPPLAPHYPIFHADSRLLDNDGAIGGWRRRSNQGRAEKKAPCHPKGYSQAVMMMPTAVVAIIMAAVAAVAVSPGKGGRCSGDKYHDNEGCDYLFHLRTPFFLFCYIQQNILKRKITISPA